MADIKDKRMLIELSVHEDHFEFASCIYTALARKLGPFTFTVLLRF